MIEAVTVQKWLKAGNPCGVPFVVWRHFQLERLREIQDPDAYIQMSMEATAKLYADGLDYELSPALSADEILSPTTRFIGEIALVPHINMGVIVAGMVLEIKERSEAENG